MSRARVALRVLGGLVTVSLLSVGSLDAQQAAAPSRIEALILSPEPGERVLQDGVLVAVSFVDRDSRLDPGSIQLQVDGRDVTPEAEVSAEVATWVPKSSLAPGPHRASLTARSRDGSSISPVSWAFTVAPGFEASAAAAALRPGAGTGFARLQGSVTFEGQAQSISGPGASFRRDEGTVPRLWVNLGGILGGGFRYSANVHISGYESSERQPVNRFRFDVRSDHLSVAVGDVNPALQDLMMSGARVRGVQGTVKGGGLGLTVVGGQSRRAIGGLLDNSGASILRPGTYGQNLLAIRPTFGGNAFLFGLTVLHVKDDIHSIDDLRTSTTKQRVSSSPKENVVVGADATTHLVGGRVLLQYESAFSLLANDISTGPITKAQLDSIMDAANYDRVNIDPSDYEKYFTINASLLPLDPRGLTSLAQKASASIRTGTNVLAAEWRSIGGSYYSLGYSSLVRDREGLRIRDSFGVLQNALNLSAGYETDKDNLDHVKPGTTNQTGIFGTANWQKSSTSAAIVASVRQGTRKNDIAKGQSGAMDEQNTALSLGVGIPVGRMMGYTTRLNTNVSLVNRDDPSNPQVESKDRYYLGGVQGQNETRTNQFMLMYGLNSSELTATAGSMTHFHRVVGDVRYLVAPQWTATFDGTYTAARSALAAGVNDLRYNRGEFMLGGEFAWTATSFLSVTAGVTSYADARTPTSNTHEVVTRLQVHRAF